LGDLTQIGLEDLLLDCEQVGRMHGELAQSEPEQYAGEALVTGHFPAYSDRHSRFVGAADDVLHQL
jgi:hypothetical protein